MLDEEYKLKLVKSIDDKENDEIYGENEIICPYCGDSEYPDCENEYYSTDGEYEQECDECGKTFRIVTHVIIDYSTSRIEET